MRWWNMNNIKIEKIDFSYLKCVIEGEWENLGDDGVGWRDYFRIDEDSLTVSFDFKGDPFVLEYSIGEYEQWYVTFEFPAIWEICDECRGNGKGLIEGFRGVDVTDMCREDPDFYYAYRGGRYDTHCSSCSGSGKVLVIDWSEKEDIKDVLYKEIKDMEYECKRPCPIQQAELRAEGGYYR